MTEDERAREYQMDALRREEFQRSLAVKLQGSEAARERLRVNWEPVELMQIERESGTEPCLGVP